MFFRKIILPSVVQKFFLPYIHTLLTTLVCSLAMTFTSYAATEEMTNIYRVSRVLMGPCTDQLRDLLHFYIHPASFPAVIQRERLRLPRLTAPQRNLILPNIGKYSGKYKDMDISLLYILLRNFCGIKTHRKGWGNTPDATDRSVSANIDRIRLARNRCGHSTCGMSKTYFKQIWSEIREAVVDLDKALGNKNKYREAVDFVRNDTMDPEMDKQYNEQLLEQMKDIETIMTKIQSLEKLTEGNENHTKQKIQTLEEQHKMQLETWKKEDAPFHEIHSFPNILDKVQSQQITTIIGNPGCGKTATARHLALQLQNNYEFEIVHVDGIKEIKKYGHPKCKQLFILDDVIGVWGFERKKLAKLDRYSEIILKVLSAHSKILLTCRKAVYNEAKILFTFKKEKYNKSADLKSLALAEELIVDLEDVKNRLNDQDRLEMLKNHYIQNGLSLSPEEQSNVPSTVGIMMYPLLCKLFCSDSLYRASGKEFFEKPHACILEEIDNLKGYKQITYASLVLCMFCPNEIAEGSFRKQDSRFMEIKTVVFKNCRVSKSDTEIIDAWNSMINTFTTRTNEGYSLIHDSVSEVLAFHYGKEHQEDMLQYMSSSFIAKKFNVNDISDNPVDFQIKLNRKHYPAFAKRLIRDLKSLELYDVFMNEALKEPCICNAFIDEVKKLSYLEIKKLFFLKQEDITKIFIRSTEKIKIVRREKKFIYEFQRQELLMGETRGEPNIRVISWVIAYGHYQLLQFLFDLVTEQKESICRVMDLKIPEESGNSYISDLEEQTRFLNLSCCNENVEVVKLIMKHYDLNCKNISLEFSSNLLLTACVVGNKPVVDFLIKCGADCNQANKEDTSPLFAASLDGHVDVVNLLIKCGANCNQADEEGITPLFAASSNGHVDVVDLLIKCGANYIEADEEGITPLYDASLAGHVDVVDLLIKCGADCNQADRERRTPLYAASLAGHVDVVDLLIKCGADCNQADEEGRSPLYNASLEGHVDVVRLFIKCGANCNQADKKGKTPLYVASSAGHVDVVRLFIKCGTDFNRPDKKGRTPLYVASSAGHVDVVDLLIKCGADCNQADKKGRTPLYDTSMAGHDDVVDLLIKCGADCNRPDKKGRTPLYVASSAGHVDVVRLFIKCGTDCNRPDKKGRTPLYVASSAGHVDVVDLLIKCGADCNQADKKGRTPLYVASSAGHVDVVRLLIKCGTDFNRPDKKGRTPLYVASSAGHVDVVELLIKCGADCNQADEEGRTPLFVASSADRVDVMDLLMKCSADCN
uniref:Uncharacterized protein LOC111112787 isoform X2 n=1 Tax=Crassostrea virginica TaxID=6565 RepID=A0A8B8BSM3_CRAVI|nr:uncharacterized protein LOC111112787 isoform X2 [Crassostrea virginica]